MTGAFARIVLAIIGKLGRESVEGTTMAAYDKALDDLTCQEVEGMGEWEVEVGKR